MIILINTREIIDIIEDTEDGRGGDAFFMLMASPNPERCNDVIEFDSSWY